jgi:hypothetical protein
VHLQEADHPTIRTEDAADTLNLAVWVFSSIEGRF